jgi:hypothetical protein
MGMTNETFKKVCDECVPEIRSMMENFDPSTRQLITPSVSMVATTEVGGEECRVRVTVEFASEDDE